MVAAPFLLLRTLATLLWNPEDSFSRLRTAPVQCPLGSFAPGEKDPPALVLKPGRTATQLRFKCCQGRADWSRASPWPFKHMPFARCLTTCVSLPSRNRQDNGPGKKTVFGLRVHGAVQAQGLEKAHSPQSPTQSPATIFTS